MKAREYRPAFFDGFENKECEFETIDDIVKQLDTVNIQDGWHFEVCSRGYDTSWTYALISISDDFKEWWVVAFLTGNPDLPIRTGHKK